MTHSEVTRAVQAAARSGFHMTPKVQEGFDKGVELTLQILQDAAVSEAIGCSAKAVISELEYKTAEAKAAVDALNIPPESIDERGKIMLAIAAAYVKTMCGTLGEKDSFTGAQTVGANLAKEIVRGASYAVWAWANPASHPSRAEGFEEEK